MVMLNYFIVSKSSLIGSIFGAPRGFTVYKINITKINNKLTSQKIGIILGQIFVKSFMLKIGHLKKPGHAKIVKVL